MSIRKYWEEVSYGNTVTIHGNKLGPIYVIGNAENGISYEPLIHEIGHIGCWDEMNPHFGRGSECGDPTKPPYIFS